MKKMLLMAIALLISCSTINAQLSYWRPVTSGTNKKLASISFGSAQVGYISGADSLLLRTVNGGVSWAPVVHTGMGFGLSSPDIIHVNFLSASTGYAIVGKLANPVYTGTLYKTLDSGRTWQASNAGNIAMARTYFFDAGNGFGIGSAFFAGHTVVKQTGGTWGLEKPLSYDPSKFLYGIDFWNSSTGIIGGHDGYVYRTFNGGASWDTVKTSVDSTINALKFLNSRTIMGASDNDGGAIIISTDTGRTWAIENSTLTFAYPDIKGLAVSKRDSFIAVGHSSFGVSGIILWYNGFTPNNQMIPQRLNAVAMRDDSVAYIVGDSGSIYTNRQALLGIVGSNGVRIPLAVYPNPASGLCYTDAGYMHAVQLYDVTGRLVLTQGQQALRHTIAVGDLAKGVYMLRAWTDDGVSAYHRVVVQ